MASREPDNMLTKTLVERYEIQRQLGRKAGRRTLLARDLKTEKLVVVKVLTFSDEFEWQDLKLFEREAQALQMLSHPAIPRYLDYFELHLPHAKGFALVQTYIDASSLEEHVKTGRTFTSAELHLGEISLECSRAGASAAALWLTFQLLPPTSDGLGQALAAGRRAARKWARLIDDSAYLTLHQQPELDIVSYFPNVEPATMAGVDTASGRVLADGMTGPDPVFLSTLKADRRAFAARHPGITADADAARVLRSVLMKPESEHHVEQVHFKVEQLAKAR